MDEVEHKTVILETIDQLRGRKARPDFKGICHMLARKHQLKEDEVTRDLDRLCEQQLVIKVDYKGRVSYRNASKWLRNHEAAGDPEADMGGELRRAVKELTREAGHTGCTLNQVHEWLKRNPARVNLTLQELKAALARECGAGNLRKNASGNYLCRDGKRPRGRTASAAAAAAPARNRPADGESAKRSRSAAKRKPFKKGADAALPSSCGMEPAKQGAAKPHCDYCLQTAETNKKGDWEELLACKDCPAKAHPSCMNYSAQLSKRAQMSPWQCIDCKTCCICQNADEPDTMLFCDACDKGYHMCCHKPAVPAKPTGKWACRRCQQDGLEPSGQSNEASPLQSDATSADHSNSPATVDSEEMSKGSAQADGMSKGSAATDDGPAAPGVMETDVSVVDIMSDNKELKTEPATSSSSLVSIESAAMVALSQKQTVAASTPRPPSSGYLPTSLRSPSVAQQLSSPASPTVAATRVPPALPQQAPALPQLVASPVQKQAPTMQLMSIVQKQAGFPEQMQAQPAQKRALPEQSQALPAPKRTAAPEQRDTPGVQEQAVPGQKQELLAQKQVLFSQKQVAPEVKQALLVQKQVLLAHKQAAPELKQALFEQKQATPEQKHALLAQTQALLAQKQALPEQKQALIQKLALPGQKQVPPLQQQAPNVPQPQHRAHSMQKQMTPVLNQMPPVQVPAPSVQQQVPPVTQRQTLSVAPTQEVPAISRYLTMPPSEWNIEDVVQFFKNNGFPEESEKFIEQEIDGKSLLLLTRNDMLANMGLLVGPALKIYERVKMLQALGSTRCLQPPARQ